MTGDEAAVIDLREPVRARFSCAQAIAAPPAEVFPLLCPVRERDWVPGWRIDWVISASGLAEPDCVFQTPGEGGEPPALWIITEHDPEARRVAMVKTVPDHTVTRLTIRVLPAGDDGSRLEITYRYTALSAAGEAFVWRLDEPWWREFTKGWETAMNHYLATGEKIEPDG